MAKRIDMDRLRSAGLRRLESVEAGFEVVPVGQVVRFGVPVLLLRAPSLPAA